MKYFDREEWPGFLAAIRAAPTDDLPRLVAADFLEENGEPERAEFVRVQCELAKGPQCRWAGPGATACGEWNEHLPSYRVETWCEPCDRHRRNYGRMSALADGIFGPMLGPVALAGGTWTVERGFVSRVRAPLAVLCGGECGRCGGVGHLDLYSCPGCYLSNAGTGRTPGVLWELLRREPLGVEGIEVSDREPWRVVGGHSWWLEHSSESDNPGMAASGLPRELFDRLVGFAARPVGDCRRYPTESAARLALSRAVYAMCSPNSEVMT